LIKEKEPGFRSLTKVEESARPGGDNQKGLARLRNLPDQKGSRMIWRGTRAQPTSEGQGYGEISLRGQGCCGVGLGLKPHQTAKDMHTSLTLLTFSGEVPWAKQQRRKVRALGGGERPSSKT